MLSPLIHHVQSSPPVEFQLPEDIRTFFKFGELFDNDIHPGLTNRVASQVGCNPRGQYIDTSLIKAPRLKYVLASMPTHG